MSWLRAKRFHSRQRVTYALPINSFPVRLPDERTSEHYFEMIAVEPAVPVKHQINEADLQANERTNELSTNLRSRGVPCTAAIAITVSTRYCRRVASGVGAHWTGPPEA